MKQTVGRLRSWIRVRTAARGTRVAGSWPAASRRCRPSAASLEGRQLLAGPAALQHTFAPTPSEYYAQPAPVASPAGLSSVGTGWANAGVYQYGPDPGQQFWVLVPPDPTGKLDLIVHGGGFHHGDPTGISVTSFAQFDLAHGTTVVSIGYRLLTDWPWPAPVDDIAVAIDDGVQVAGDLTGKPVSDISETGISAGGTALALINYSPEYPTTAARPNRIVTISAPLMTDAVSPGRLSFGFRYTDALRWHNIVPKARVPITLMGTPGDRIAIENGTVSNIRQFASYLGTYHVPCATYFDPHDPGHHGSVARDMNIYPDVAGAVAAAEDFNG